MITKKLIHALFERFITIYGKKFTHDFDGHAARVAMWAEDWYEGLMGIPPESLKDALQHTKMNLPWPPSLPEFRSLCERFMGLPSQQDVLTLGVRRDFSHPLVKKVYDKIGSFNFHNMSEEKLTKLIAIHYPEELADMRMASYKEGMKQLEHQELKAIGSN